MRNFEPVREERNAVSIFDYLTVSEVVNGLHGANFSEYDEEEEYFFFSREKCLYCPGLYNISNEEDQIIMRGVEYNSGRWPDYFYTVYTPCPIKMYHGIRKIFDKVFLAAFPYWKKLFTEFFEKDSKKIANLKIGESFFLKKLKKEVTRNKEGWLVGNEQIYFFADIWREGKRKYFLSKLRK